MAPRANKLFTNELIILDSFNIYPGSFLFLRSCIDIPKLTCALTTCFGATVITVCVPLRLETRVIPQHDWRVSR